MDLNHIEIPPIADEHVFEMLCLDLWKRKLENAQLNGRRGQKQDGVDVYGRKRDTVDWVGIQCKVRSGSRRLSEKDDGPLQAYSCRLCTTSSM